MKKLSALMFLASVVVFLLGCASSGPSPEERANELERQREAERQQAEFRKGLPPITNPGRGQ
jgi:outer membrane lipoprotein-sorting protein